MTTPTPLLVWDPTDTHTVELTDAGQPRAVVRVRGFRRHWTITARAGQVLTLAPVRGNKENQSIRVHASEVILAKLVEPEPADD